jgi:hypothetical protein
MFGISAGSNSGIDMRLRVIERKLDAIMDQLGIKLPDDGMQDIRDLAAAGQKIEAIKLYRERTGVGLAQAKNAVERGV